MIEMPLGYQWVYMCPTRYTKSLLIYILRHISTLYLFASNWITRHAIIHLHLPKLRSIAPKTFTSVCSGPVHTDRRRSAHAWDWESRIHVFLQQSNRHQQLMLSKKSSSEALRTQEIIGVPNGQSPRLLFGLERSDMACWPKMCPRTPMRLYMLKVFRFKRQRLK